MEESPASWESMVEAMDDWQRGFIDSVFYSQQITHPTAAQYSAALKRMNGFVRSRNGGHIPSNGRMSLASDAR